MMCEEMHILASQGAVAQNAVHNTEQLKHHSSQTYRHYDYAENNNGYN